MSKEAVCEILHVEMGEFVRAEIVEFSGPTMVGELESQWWYMGGLGNLKQRRHLQRELDEGWPWFKYLQQAKQHEGGGLVLKAQGAFQAALVFWKNQNSAFEPGKKAYWISHIATAPWNRKSVREASVFQGSLLWPDSFRGAATALLMFVIRLSLEEPEHEGRVNLVPSSYEGVVEFYEKQGFQRTDRADEEGIGVVYELTGSNATKLLRRTQSKVVK